MLVNRTTSSISLSLPWLFGRGFFSVPLRSFTSGTRALTALTTTPSVNRMLRSTAAATCLQTTSKSRCISQRKFRSVGAFVRCFSSDNTNAEVKRHVLEDDLEFHKRANAILEDFQTEIQAALEPVMENFDGEYSDGVLTLKLGSNGTYVINKQAPNKQIWWSSPISGPKRFCFDLTQKRWVSTRDGQCLVSLLSKELTQLTKVHIDLLPLIEKHKTLL
eukprot:TRINITY_DN10170_c0_g1_i1.p1 TRINITY_DN10170_c0_g1~~TRINITY_DN10170_c0_g1_i1.p1  ORF type:complete len:237 (-),score=29.18 TRINITY_DN10170_c0_g1_i1:92-748(-)